MNSDRLGFLSKVGDAGRTTVNGDGCLGEVVWVPVRSSTGRARLWLAGVEGAWLARGIKTKVGRTEYQHCNFTDYNTLDNLIVKFLGV